MRINHSLFCIMIFVFNINLSFSQNAFYEAQFLSNLDSEELKEMVASGDQIKQQLVSFNNSEKNEIKNLVSFLKDPFSDDVSSINFAIVQVIINKYNQYIVDRREFSKGPVGAAKHFLPTAGASMALSFIPNLISGNTSLSDTAQSNIIDGLTKYYAEEFKKAQTISYMKAFEATAGKIGELQIIFPESYYKLKNADPSKFPDLGNEYKKIFNEDLKNAWPNLLSYIENYPDNAINDQYLSLLKAKNLTTIRSHEAYFPIVISSDILSKLVENQHPVEVISFIDNKYYDPKKLGDDSNKSKIANTIHGIEILQSNLRDTSKVIGNNFSNVWIGAEQLKQLNTENEIKYFLGLIYQQDRDYFNYLFSQIGIDKSKIEELKYFIDKKVRPLITYFNTIQEVGKSYKKSEDYEVLVKYLEANIELYLSLELIYEDDNLTKYFQTSKNLVYIYGSVKKTDYSNATYYILNILNEFLGDDQAYQNVIFKIDEYGGFMAEIVNAENSDAVKETITKFAAPPSSFILKRTYRHTFSITGQPGYFASYERLKEQKDWKFVSGITLPIGFEYSYKTKKDFMNTRGSIGLFVQLIDLGAVLNFRIDDSTSELPDQITFEQIFSPGGSINYGFKNSPLTIAVGYQYTPELRKITLENGTEKFTKGDRWFVRLAWDIPLINIGKSKSR